MSHAAPLAARGSSTRRVIGAPLRSVPSSGPQVVAGGRHPAAAIATSVEKVGRRMDMRCRRTRVRSHRRRLPRRRAAGTRRAAPPGRTCPGSRTRHRVQPPPRNPEDCRESSDSTQHGRSDRPWRLRRDLHRRDLVATSGCGVRRQVEGSSSMAERPRRNVVAWLLPGCSDPAQTTRSPVLAMHDDRNCVRPSTAFRGRERRADEVADRLVGDDHARRRELAGS